ncbi:MAG: type II secretion system GspH family protein [Clostridiaceae bacterium]|nr:type II secretion system GspH family protein [Clostridiaceae bacterium]
MYKFLTKSKLAFSLVEVLITLGIIGIVAALTLPPLVQNYRAKQRATQLKKVYSELNNAYIAVKEADGDPSTWGGVQQYDAGTHKTFAENFRKQMLNIVTRDSNPTDASFVLSDGTRLSFRIISPSCTWWVAGKSCGRIIADLNGDKRPNVYGEDQFGFYITKEYIRPNGSPEDKINVFCTSYDRNKDSYWGAQKGSGCAYWLLTYENQDYLKCPELLEKTGAHSCDEAKNLDK